MPRKKFECSPSAPYHISVRTIDGSPFPLTIDKTWILMENYLFFISHAFGIQIISFVLMNNHFHLICLCPHSNLSEAMMYFLRETSRCIKIEASASKKIYSERFFRCLIEKNCHFETVYKYVYRNPVKAGISSTVENYSFSTLPGILGYKNLIIPVYDPHLERNITNTISWLNKPTLKENDDAIRRALLKKKFQLTDSRKPHPLEYTPY